MPFYRYECESCGRQFRILHLEGSSEPVTCPSCGGQEARRLLSRVSVQFKGSGYYRTDRAGKRTNAKAAAPSKDDTASSENKQSSSAADPSDGE